MLLREEDDDTLAYDGPTRVARRKDYRACAVASWDMLCTAEKAQWECYSRTQLQTQPNIRDRIIEVLKNNPKTPYREVANAIGNWCSASTIERWMKSFPSYSTYLERPLPMLTRSQMAKHVTFAKHFLNKWGLPANQKVFLIHYDEKWFYGMVPRANAKKCEEVGLERK
mmetsp:Transcript_10823/g.17325  ORF Transcript_10823/g.17325 Transcript_10823/m.17325 type:complete len:169 (-) Transcript_10823:853-1359(-)